ncbi:MAG: hypothetical protein A4E66_01321 [Syntrophus sp. PtaB.Bin001]|nr:MAG: hypothetical protein A4E66_01321 [Syntrophus sp. PtaB.Bin001]
MTSPTSKEAKENNIKKLIGEIWEQECGRNKDDLTSVVFDDRNFIVVKTCDREAEIHDSLFDDYFRSTDEQKKQSARKNIKNFLDEKI